MKNYRNGKQKEKSARTRGGGTKKKMLNEGKKQQGKYDRFWTNV